MIKLSIFGMGYVGVVTGACLAKRGIHVIGVEKNREKVAQINGGTSPILEPGLNELLKDLTGKGLFKATTDAELAVLNTDISFVAVGTYSSADGYPDLRALFAVMDEIGNAIKKKDTYHTIVIRSTVPPGTTDVAMKRIEQASGKKLGKDFGGGMHPEFLREGVALTDFEKPPFIVYGAVDEKSGKSIREVYGQTDAPLYITEVHLAEILKYSCNIFHALKVAFGNEIGRVCHAAGINGNDLMDIFIKDTVLNISGKYLRPGMPFGGSCLPKDLRGFISHAESKGIQVPLLDSILDSNDSQFADILRRIEQYECRKIGVVGITFKENTDDMRESPVIKLVRCLIDRGHDMSIYDAAFDERVFVGTNLELLQRLLPEAQQLRKSSIRDLVDTSDLVVFTNSGYKNEPGLRELLAESNAHVFDIDGTYKAISPADRYHGLCW